MDVLIRLDAKFLIMDINESALEIFCNLFFPLAVLQGVFKADKGCKVNPEVALFDSIDSILDSYKSSDPEVCPKGKDLPKYPLVTC